MAVKAFSPERLVKVKTKYVADPTFSRQYGLSPSWETRAGFLAELSAKNVKSIAPVGDTEPHYKDMIEAQVRLIAGRFVGRVAAHKYTSHWLEFGTVKMRPRAPLRRGVEMTGLRVVQTRRRKRSAG